MSEYKPDRWLVVKIKTKEDTCYKVFGCWHGSYMDSSGSWKLNSGITKVTKDKRYYNFEGFSGSVYKCHENAYGSTAYGFSVINNIIERSKEVGGTVEILPEDTNWIELLNEL